MSIVMASPLVNFKFRWLKMMSVPESRTAVGRSDRINGRDSQYRYDLLAVALLPVTPRCATVRDHGRCN